MTQTDNIYKLFNPSGCLKAEIISDFINLELSEKEQKLVKNHISYCELCKEATEGLRNLKKKEDLKSIVDEIKGDLNSKLPGNTINFSIKSHKIFYISSAASIAILIGLLFYLNNPFQKISEKNNLKENLLVESKSIPPMPEAIHKTQIKTSETEISSSDNQSLIQKTKVSQGPNSKNTNNNIKEPAYSAPIAELENAVKSPSINLQEAKVDSLLKGPESSYAYTDIASNQPFEYYLAEIIVTNSQTVKAEEFETLFLEIPGEDEMSKSKTPDMNRDSLSEVHFPAFVETMPEFQGGYAGLTTYLSQNLNYPRSAKERNTSGRVVISFIIEKNGEVSDVKILYGISEDCNQEALRVISSMPAWSPATQNGNPVKILFTLPITFQLL